MTREILNTYPKRWLVYVYRGNIVIKEGVIYNNPELVFPHYSFYPYDYFDKSYRYSYTQLSEKPLTLGCGKVWCESAEDIDKAIAIIKQHYTIRKELLENDNAIERADKVINYNSEKTDILKKCPFCGSDCDIQRKPIHKGHNKTGIIPEGAKVYKTVELPKYITYYWSKERYIPRCSNANCILSTNLRSYNTLAETIKAWNTRKRS